MALGSKKFSNDKFQLVHGSPGNDSVTYGDAYELVSMQSGGNDTFTGADSGYGYHAYGDAFTIGDRTHGGNDTFIGGSYVNGGGIWFAGDADSMFGMSIGGNDTMTGGVNSYVNFIGDASGTMKDQSHGGNDLISGGTADGAGSEFDGVSNVIGDAWLLDDAAHGGNDTLTGGDARALNFGHGAYIDSVFGDAVTMQGLSVGGNDIVKAGSVVANGAGSSASVLSYLAGDALFAHGSPTFGADSVAGANATSDAGASASSLNHLSGDVQFFNTDGGMKFGADTLVGGSASGEGASTNNTLWGDMGMSQGYFGGLPDAPANHVANTFGADKLYGGSGQASNFLGGDAELLFAGEKGGNDLLVGGNTPGVINYLVGDAIHIYSAGTGGNDTLVSGAGNDWMYGDAYQGNAGNGGADLFVFAPGNGNDVIADFDPTMDHISLQAFRSETAMPHNWRALSHSDLLEQTGDGLLVHLGDAPGDGTILLIGVTLADLTTTSFVF